jgi:hypothetical protein
VVHLEPDGDVSPAAPVNVKRDASAELRRGKELLAFYLAVTVVICLATCFLELAVWRGGLLFPAILIALTAWLCFALYSGSLDARRIGVVLFGLASVIGLAAVVMMQNLFVAMWLSPLVAFFFSFALVLENSRSVNAFMAHQRSERAAPGNLPVPHEKPPAECSVPAIDPDPAQDRTPASGSGKTKGIGLTP